MVKVFADAPATPAQPKRRNRWSMRGLPNGWFDLNDRGPGGTRSVMTVARVYSRARADIVLDALRAAYPDTP